jgi:hypothetical protein
MASHKTAIQLPHPYLTAYALADSGHGAEGSLRLEFSPRQPSAAQPPPLPLHDTQTSFLLRPAPQPPTPAAAPRPPGQENTPAARAERAEMLTIWGRAETTAGQLWLIAYYIVSTHHTSELFQVAVHDAPQAEAAAVIAQLLLPHPLEVAAAAAEGLPHPARRWILSRSAFWQGAGSPFGPRPVWVADPSTCLPLTPGIVEQVTSEIAARGGHVRHPLRPPKPARRSVVYSRWIPHLGETLSMVALDWRLDAHLHAFHEWQNSPRVARGWNQTGTLDEHRAYLEALEKDPHALALIGRFDDELFAYFEVYWAAEDLLGAYYRADEWDRGRHFLVGNERLRGPPRVRAWWSGLAHYCFLDDARTQRVVGEPRESNVTVARYDREHGFWHECPVDLPHKRANLAMVSRDRFFRMAVFHWGEEEGGEQQQLKRQEEEQ